MTRHLLAWVLLPTIRNALFATILGGIVLQIGCSGRPPTVYAPDVDASVAANGAFATYDSNGDGALTRNELEACPGVLRALQYYDTDGDGAISHEEFEARIANWKIASPAMMSVECRVMLDNRPLEGATIRFVPEPYLEDYLKPASGVTGESGIAAISLAAEDMPEQLRRIKAMHAGTYKVEITHPNQSIPARYNADTTLGREISKQTTVSPFDDFRIMSR